MCVDDVVLSTGVCSYSLALHRPISSQLKRPDHSTPYISPPPGLSMENSPVSQAAFEAKYRQSGDPWNFTGSRYELDRYRFTLKALMRARYRRAFEPACSIGVLTAALAERCDEVQAIDIAPTAVTAARERCARFAGVTVTCADLATQCPEGPFDLIVFSELGYYFTTTELALIARALADRLEAGGEFVAVHWLGRSEDHLLHGDDVHAVLEVALASSCTWVKGARHPGFRLDTWRRNTA